MAMTTDKDNDKSELQEIKGLIHQLTTKVNYHIWFKLSGLRLAKIAYTLLFCNVIFLDHLL